MVARAAVPSLCPPSIVRVHRRHAGRGPQRGHSGTGGAANGGGAQPPLCPCWRWGVDWGRRTTCSPALCPANHVQTRSAVRDGPSAGVAPTGQPPRGRTSAIPPTPPPRPAVWRLPCGCHAPRDTRIAWTAGMRTVWAGQARGWAARAVSRRGRAATAATAWGPLCRHRAPPPTGHFAAWSTLSQCGVGPRGVRGYIYVGQWCDLYSAFDSCTVASTWGSRWGHGDVTMRRCPVS